MNPPPPPWRPPSQAGRGAPGAPGDDLRFTLLIAQLRGSPVLLSELMSTCLTGSVTTAFCPTTQPRHTKSTCLRCPPALRCQTTRKQLPLCPPPSICPSRAVGRHRSAAHVARGLSVQDFHAALPSRASLYLRARWHLVR